MGVQSTMNPSSLYAMGAPSTHPAKPSCIFQSSSRSLRNLSDTVLILYESIVSIQCDLIDESHGLVGPTTIYSQPHPCAVYNAWAHAK